MSFNNPNRIPPNPADCKPTFRDTAVFAIGGEVRKLVEAMHIDAYKTCITCINFQEHATFGKPAGWCTRFSPQVGPVPARIIAYGCPDYYHNDEIPF